MAEFLTFLETYKVIAAVVALVLAFADGWTTYNVIHDGDGREGNWMPAKLIKAVGLLPYLIVSRLMVAGALWLEPAAGYPLAILFAVVTYHNIGNNR